MATDDAKNNWADMVEDEPAEESYEVSSPQGAETKTESKTLKDGTRVITEIVSKDGGKFKVTKYMKETKRTYKVFKSAEERKARWRKFGKAEGQNAAELTVISEPVRLELGKKEEINKNKIETEIQKMVHKVSVAVSGAGSVYVPPDKKSGDGAKGEEETKKTYVAPGKSSGDTADSRPQRDDSCTVRITNVSEDISEDDLRAVFQKYGAISRSYVAVDKVSKERRGFAFITFREREHAAAAIKGLDRHAMQHVILQVGWAKPPAQNKAA